MKKKIKMRKNLITKTVMNKKMKMVKMKVLIKKVVMITVMMMMMLVMMVLVLRPDQVEQVVVKQNRKVKAMIPVRGSLQERKTHTLWMLNL